MISVHIRSALTHVQCDTILVDGCEVLRVLARTQPALCQRYAAVWLPYLVDATAALCRRPSSSRGSSSVTASSSTSSSTSSSRNAGDSASSQSSTPGFFASSPFQRKFDMLSVAHLLLNAMDQEQSSSSSSGTTSSSHYVPASSWRVCPVGVDRVDVSSDEVHQESPNFIMKDSSMQVHYCTFTPPSDLLSFSLMFNIFAPRIRRHHSILWLCTRFDRFEPQRCPQLQSPPPCLHRNHPAQQSLPLQVPSIVCGQCRWICGWSWFLRKLQSPSRLFKT